MLGVNLEGRGQAASTDLCCLWKPLVLLTEFGMWGCCVALATLGRDPP